MPGYMKKPTAKSKPKLTRSGRPVSPRRRRGGAGGKANAMMSGPKRNANRQTRRTR